MQITLPVSSNDMKVIQEKKFPYLQLISLPLTVKGREEKRKMAEKSVMLADHIADDGQRVQALARCADIFR